MKRKLLISLFILAAAAAVFGYQHRIGIKARIDKLFQKDVPAVTFDELQNTQHDTPTVNSATNSVNTNTLVNTQVEKPLPETFNLAVPFTTQSPYAKWTAQDEESCEEAASLIVHYYWQHKTFTNDIAAQELQRIVDYENATLGFYKDTTAQQTANVIKGLWGYKRVDVKYGITIDDIKREVAQGRPVIIPTAGRLLGNPNFKSPGPIYHMLVVRGWTKDMIITNDPGTRKGEQYQYKPDVLYNAIHDWVEGGDITTGAKAMIVVWPNE